MSWFSNNVLKHLGIGGDARNARAQQYVDRTYTPGMFDSPGFPSGNAATAMMQMQMGQSPFGFQGPSPMEAPYQEAPEAFGQQMDPWSIGEMAGNPASPQFGYKKGPEVQVPGLTDTEKAALIAQIIGTVGGLGLQTWGAYKAGKQADRQEARVEEDRERDRRDREARAKALAPILRQYLGR